MSRCILVSSNCQSGVIASGLRLLFPDSEILAENQPGSGNADVVRRFAEVLRRADVWVRYHDFGSLIADPEISALCAEKKTVDIPHINFRGFHPDIFSARSRATGRLITPNDHSGILIWCYRHQIDPGDAAALFSAEVFSNLGYFSLWDDGERWLRGCFDWCGLDFRRFFQRAKRSGVFMYTAGHPKAHVLMLLAKLVGIKIGLDDRVFDDDILVNDSFPELLQWPVYPAVGEYLAVPSSYNWTINRRRLTGLESFIEFSYERFAAESESPADLELIAYGPWAERFDSVLGGKVGAGK